MPYRCIIVDVADIILTITYSSSSQLEERSGPVNLSNFDGDLLRVGVSMITLLKTMVILWLLLLPPSELKTYFYKVADNIFGEKSL